MGDTRITESGTELFLSAEVLWHETPTARIAYQRVGRGPALVFLHGWPLWSFTFRELLPHLVDNYTCYLIDLPGGGNTVWTRDTDSTWPGQAASVKSLLEELALEEYFLSGQDSGAMVARYLCLLDGRRVRKFVMTNTEVPGHRPPYLPTYRRLAYFPGASAFTRIALAMGGLLRSDLGFGASISPERIDGEFRDHIIRPLVRSRYRARGHLRFLRGELEGVGPLARVPRANPRAGSLDLGRCGPNVFARTRQHDGRAMIQPSRSVRSKARTYLFTRNSPNEWPPRSGGSSARSACCRDQSIPQCRSLDSGTRDRAPELVCLYSLPCSHGSISWEQLTPKRCATRNRANWFSSRTGPRS